MKVRKPVQLILCSALIALLGPHTIQADEAQLKEIEEIKAEISTLEEKLAEIEKGGDAGSDIKSNITAAESEIAETKSVLSERENEIAEKEYLLSVYQSAFRVVSKLERGASLGNLTMPDGSTLQNVVFVGIANGAVQLQTSAGLRTVPAGSLPTSLAGNFQLPPKIAPLASGLEVIYSQKPEVAMTESDKNSASPVAKFASNTAATPAKGETAEGASTPVSNAATAAETESAEKPDYVLIKERNDVRLARIQELRVAYSDLYAQMKKLKAERYSEQAAFNSSKIKKSKAIQDKVFGAIDKKVDALDTKIRNLKNEMNTLRSQME